MAVENKPDETALKLKKELEKIVVSLEFIDSIMKDLPHSKDFRVAHKDLKPNQEEYVSHTEGQDTQSYSVLAKYRGSKRELYDIQIIKHNENPPLNHLTTPNTL